MGSHWSPAEAHVAMAMRRTKCGSGSYGETGIWDFGVHAEDYMYKILSGKHGDTTDEKAGEPFGSVKR